MHGFVHAWVLLCCCHSALALRWPKAHPNPKKETSSKSEPECVGGGKEINELAALERAQEELWERFQEGVREGAFARVDPEALRLDGGQWCKQGGGGPPNATLKNRVAMILIGQAFRSRNYVTVVRSSCTKGTKAVQMKLVDNHLDKIVRPIEDEIGMEVDVFLTVAPCGVERRRKRRVYDAAPPDEDHFDGPALLRQWYGKKVKGTTMTEVQDNMYERVVRTFNVVADYMKKEGGTYEYFIVSRYDVFFDKTFTSTIDWKHGSHAHNGLQVFAYAHDFFFAFPGEMWGCMQEFWAGCLAKTEWRSLNETARREHGCFDFGPLELPVWAGGFGYAMLMTALNVVLRKEAPALTVSRQHQLGRAGTSAFDARGREHRCLGATYYPPRHTFENRSMPAYFHVG